LQLIYGTTLVQQQYACTTHHQYYDVRSLRGSCSSMVKAVDLHSVEPGSILAVTQSQSLVESRGWNCLYAEEKFHVIPGHIWTLKWGMRSVKKSSSGFHFCHRRCFFLS